MAVAKKPVAKTVDETIETVTAAATESVKVAQEVVADFAKPFADAQEQIRSTAEKGLEQLRSHYATLKSNAETVTDKLEESVAAAHAGTRDFNIKVFEFFRANSNAAFEHAQKLFAAKTVSDAVKLQQDFAKTQIEAVQAHAKELAEMAKKIAADVAEPVKAGAVLPFKK